MPIHGTIPQCQYIKTDGTRCGSPALKTKRWCYFHYEVNRKTVVLDIPPLEDGNAVQLALTDLARAVADDRIPLKNAAQLAYILQAASANLKRVHIGVHTSSMVTDAPDLDPYFRGPATHDSPQSSVILSEAASASEGPGRPPAQVREGRIRSAPSSVKGQGFTPAERNGAPAPTALPTARGSEGHGFSRAEQARPMNSSPLPKAGAQPAGAAPRKTPSASIRGKEVTQKIAAKSGSLKDVNALLNLLKDVG